MSAGAIMQSGLEVTVGVQLFDYYQISASAGHYLYVIAITVNHLLEMHCVYPIVLYTSQPSATMPEQTVVGQRDRRGLVNFRRVAFTLAFCVNALALGSTVLDGNRIC